MEKVIVWAAAVGGVLQLSHLDVYDLDLFDGDRLARQTTLDLFVAWGADRALLDAAVARVDQLAESGPLAPPLPHEQYSAPSAKPTNLEPPRARALDVDPLEA